MMAIAAATRRAPRMEKRRAQPSTSSALAANRTRPSRGQAGAIENGCRLTVPAATARSNCRKDARSPRERPTPGR